MLVLVLAISLPMLAACGSSAPEEAEETSESTSQTAASTSDPAATEAPAPTEDTSSGAAVPTPEPQTGSGTTTTSSGDPTPTPYAFAARSELLTELDERYPWPPKAPPWPPERGGVVHLTMSPIPDLDPTRARNNENLAQYDALMEWESTWWFPEIHTTPTIRPNIAMSWEAVDPTTWDFHINPMPSSTTSSQ